MRDDERRQRLEEHLDDVDRRTTRIGHPIKARIDERAHSAPIWLTRRGVICLPTSRRIAVWSGGSIITMGS